MEVGKQRLLGRLAELSWFTANGEVAATRSVAMLLENDHLRATTLVALQARTKVDVSAVVRFLAERVHVDGGRPDVEGLDIEDRPLVVIEAKFGAALSVSQVSAYLADQSSRLAAGSEGIFVLLVPETRVAEAEFKIQQAFQERAESEWPEYRSTPLVLTWSEWLDGWEAAVASDTPSPDGLSSDIVQLRAMCLALGGVVIAPLGAAANGAAWRSREDEYRVVTDEVTRALSNPGERLAPLADEPDYSARRYFPSGLVTQNGPLGAAAVGIQVAFADTGATPIWLRYHRKTDGFTDILGRVLASDYRAEARRDEGHLWIPLNVDPNLGGPELVSDLVAQVKSVQRTLSRRTWD